MLVPCPLHGLSCILLLKGPLHSGTQKGFARQDGPQEESPGLKRSGGLSPSRHNLLPQARTTSLRVCMCRQRALAPGTIGPASHLVLVLFRPGCRPQSRGLPCALRLHLPGSSCAACMCRDTTDSPRCVPAHPGGTKARGKESRQDSLPPPASRRTCCKRRPLERSKELPGSFPL